MAVTVTKPTVGGSQGTWGATLNTALDDIVAVLNGTTAMTPDLTSFDISGVPVTATAAELNILDGVTATAAEINVLDGITATVTELNYVDGVTSPIQTQLDAKQASDATLTALAGVLTAAGKIPYATALDTAGELDFKDEDDMASDSATAVPSQQSVKAYVDTEVGAINPNSMTLLATVATTSGLTVTESGLDFSGYTKLEIVFDGVSTGSTSSNAYVQMQFGSGGYQRVTDATVDSASNTIDGICTVHITSGSFVSITAETGGLAQTFAGTFGNVSAQTSISFDLGASISFDAGQILIYGVK